MTNSKKPSSGSAKFGTFAWELEVEDRSLDRMIAATKKWIKARQAKPAKPAKKE